MRKIVLSTIAMALIAGSASHALAAQKQHRAREATQTTSEQFRDARNAVTQPSQPGWQYSGWSAPAGR
ncbi:hypothetical protein [Bradyrhizobium monzae]|uniref:hypothetical protein n=1 Tax=Bradyrhizobium sp. Oc8 TaxID=2876780 RepID=UPI001F2D80AA|nr:hypothetical protein [Bradyrhizobium sp. Oc8]